MLIKTNGAIAKRASCGSERGTCLCLAAAFPRRPFARSTFARSAALRCAARFLALRCRAARARRRARTLGPTFGLGFAAYTIAAFGGAGEAASAAVANGATAARQRA